MAVKALSESEIKDFIKLFRFYMWEAQKSETAKAYLSASIMIGSALETMLILMAGIYAEELASLPSVPRKKPTVTDWTFSELLTVAKDMGWLPARGLPIRSSWTGKKPLIGDFTELIRAARNFVHPARYAVDYFPRRITLKILSCQYEILDTCRSWLAYFNYENLLKEIETFERKER